MAGACFRGKARQSETQRDFSLPDVIDRNHWPQALEGDEAGNLWRCREVDD